jgi:transcriptional regulator with XRE-family HTH domain
LSAVAMKVRKTIDIDAPGLGERIRLARERDRRSLAKICREIPMSTMNWYKLEKEETKAIPLETLQRIEVVLGVSFGVDVEPNSRPITPPLAITQAAAPEMTPEQEAEWRARMLAQIDDEEEQDLEDDDDDISEEEAIEIERKNKFTLIATKEQFAEYGKLKTKKEQEDFMDDCIKTHQP